MHSTVSNNSTSNSLNPVFGPQHNNEFSTEMAYRELKSADGLRVEVVDWDAVGANDPVGFATIAPARVLEMAEGGKPTSVQLQAPPGRKEKSAGYMILTIAHPVEESDDDW